MEVIIAELSGFCPGVKKAIKKTEELLNKTNKFVCYGNPTVHNDDVMKHLSELGFHPYGDGGLRGVYVVSAHGASPSEFKKIKEEGFEIFDTTCPKVKRFQLEVVQAFAEGYQIIIFGKNDHPEIKGVVGCIQGRATVIDGIAEAYGAIVQEKAMLFCQTTLNRSDFEEVSRILWQKNAKLRLANTICPHVEKKVAAACKLASEVDAMIVIGSSKSSNSKQLAKAISQDTDCPVYFVENERNLDVELFKGFTVLGITAGASTPEETIDKIVERLKNL